MNQQYRKINNITGWAIFAIALIVYVMTMEKHGSLWDTGEFASTAYRMGIPHPPGAPMFIIIGRIFAFVGEWLGFSPSTSITFSSALCSAFTILFLFWTITHFARKLVLRKGDALDLQNIISVMAAGAVGALAYTFSDSFWYSAVEPEVYAMSSLCTAVVFWAALKWEDHPGNTNDPANAAGRNQADRWMILIFFIMGMSIGVHLLNLLTIPAIATIFYFKRYKTTTKGLLLSLFLGVFMLGFVQKVVGQYSVGAGFEFEKLFVNSFGAPVLVGFLFFFVLVGVAIYFALRLANNNNWYMLRLGLWCLAFTLIGMSTYLTTMIRSKSNPGVDMYNVDNPYALKGYLGREQYGDFPLLFGQHYVSTNTGMSVKGHKYVLRKDESGDLKYIKAGIDREAKYISSDQMLLPRMWEDNDPNHKAFYNAWLDPDYEVIEITYDERGITGQSIVDKGDGDKAIFSGENKKPMAEELAKQLNQRTQQGSGFFYQAREHVTYGMNLRWLMGYQVNWMYFRYFMWNFAGKQNDNQGMSSLRDGNWISGIPFIDNARLGNQDKMPDSLKNSNANNKLYFLPFILGIIGFIYQLMNGRKDWFVAKLLFLLTGLAIVFYLNQYGPQPRERDYAYVGSFYAFAIWIGLGVLQIKEWINKLAPRSIANIAAAGVCTLAVPVLMVSQEWDDHDRSKKTLAPDLATDYLESCPLNAILFTIGDNDTYPLWFAQEVKGIRKDVRVVNTSLLGIDWYLDQLRYKVNESAPFKMVWEPSDYEGGKMEAGTVKQYPGYPADYRFRVDSLLKLALKQTEQRGENGEEAYYYPSKNYYVPVDQAKISKIVKYSQGDSAVSRMDLSIGSGRGYLTKGDFGIMNVIAGNINDRPICFTDINNEINSLGIAGYLRREGMVYRLVPAYNLKRVETARSYELMKKGGKFAHGNAATKGVYYDEENRRHLQSIRDAYVEVAVEMAQDNEKEKAKELLRRVDEQIPTYSLPYGMPSRGGFNNASSMQMSMASYLAGDSALGKKIFDEVDKDVMQELRYYHGLSNPGSASDEKEVKAFIDLFESLPALEAEYQQFIGRPLTKEEDARANQIKAKMDNARNELFKNKLTGSFVLQDFYSTYGNYERLKQLRKQFVNPQPVIQAPPASETNKPTVNNPGVAPAGGQKTP
jgi:hypothetical protein